MALSAPSLDLPVRYINIDKYTSQLLQYGAGSSSDRPCQRIVCRKVDSTTSWTRLLCRSVRSSVRLMSSNSLGSVALMLRAKFHDRCVIGTMDFMPSTLLYSYRSNASWYCRQVNGPTFHAMLLHQPLIQQQSSRYLLSAILYSTIKPTTVSVQWPCSRCPASAGFPSVFFLQLFWKRTCWDFLLIRRLSCHPINGVKAMNET